MSARTRRLDLVRVSSLNPRAPWRPPPFRRPGGLSREEFRQFLVGVDDPPDVARYFENEAGESYADLPWAFKTTYNALACWCQALGRGEGCCVGDGANVQIAFTGLVEEDEASRQAKPLAQQRTEREYRINVCDTIAAVFEAARPSSPVPADPALTALPTTAPTWAPTPAPTTAPTLMPITSKPSASSGGSASPPSSRPSASASSDALPLLPTENDAEGWASRPSSRPSVNASSVALPFLPADNDTIPISNLLPPPPGNGTADATNKPDSSGGLDAGPLNPGETLGIALAAALVGFSLGYAYVFRRKNSREEDAALDDVRNQDLDGDAEAGPPDEEMPGGGARRVDDGGRGKEAEEPVAGRGGKGEAPAEISTETHGGRGQEKKRGDFDTLVSENEMLDAAKVIGIDPSASF